MRATVDVKHELANSVSNVPPGSTAMGPTNPRQWLKLTLGVRRTQRLPYLPGLPRTRTSLSRPGLRDAYGSDPAAVAKIHAFAIQNHLIVTKDERLSARISLAGTVQDLCAAFDVRLSDYTHPDLGDFHARSSAVSLPAELTGAVTGVFGFNNHRILRRTKRAEALDVHSWNAAAKPCLGLLEFGRCVNERDLAAWFTRNDKPLPDVKIVNLSSSVAVCDSAGDVMRDIESASATGARVAVYFSSCDSKGLVDCVAKIVDDEENAPQVISINWGCDESQPLDGHIVWSPATIEHVNESFLALAHLGVTVCVAADDAKALAGNAHVNFPATSPYVLAIGAVSDTTPLPAWAGGTVTRRSAA
ncbi:MAG TPA: protease pro-enzyme activation domain-containing protein [Myxococcales bacterium]|nr:protease pro-enzyme activation domain-containing protein [Myxococcales bacterium]